jgi:hypothetical protein
MPYNASLRLLLLMFGGMLLSRNWWEAGMVMHMAVQIPLLALLGGMFALVQGRRYPGLHVLGRRYRAGLLLFSLFVLGLWMLPRLLDAAVHATDIAIMKWLTLPMAGAALALCWRHLPIVLRGVLHLEALATLLRLGWLYLIAPQRYCVSYGLDEQQTLGYVLLGYAAIYAAVLAWTVMFGQFLPDVLRMREVEHK